MEYLKFTGTGSEYFKIWIVNILLTIITLGFYTPWAKVRNRRYFYANTTLANRNFEYHATGKQLFLGYIIGLILFIIYAGVTKTAPQFAGIFMLLMMLVFPWLIWKSLMFNMKVTSFSNVYFSFKGKLGTSYKIFLGYPILLFLVFMLLGVGTSILIPAFQHGDIPAIPPYVMVGGGILLGLLATFAYLYFFAFMKKKTAEYTLSNSYYGQGKFETELETKKFFVILLKAMGLMLLPMILFSAVVAPMMEGGRLAAGAEIVFVVAYFGFLFFMMLVGAFFVTRERKYVYTHTLFDNEIVFDSTLRARDFAWVMVSNFFLVLITVGLAFPWAKVRMAKLMLENTWVDTSGGFDDYITTQENDVSSIGDQIGDAFDVDVGVAF